MSGLAEIADLAGMVPVIRLQQQADLRSVFLDTAAHPLCAWPDCQHRAARDHGEAANPPRYECEPHARYGVQYERVRVRAGVVFGTAGALGGLAAALVGKDEDLRTRGRALLVEGVRSFIHTHTKAPRKG